MKKMLLKILQILLFLELWCVNICSFGFIEALDLKGILNLLKKRITSAVECADETVFTFATRRMRAMLQ